MNTNVVLENDHAFNKVIADQALGAQAHPEITFVSHAR